MTVTSNHRTPPEHSGGHDSSFADMVERLFRRFDTQLSLPTIVAVVRESREQLRGSPLGALPELTERLAFERLERLADATGPGADSAMTPSGRIAVKEDRRMSALDKAKNKLEEVTGKAKETVGEHTGDRDLANEGRADQTKGDLKQAGEKVKDAFKD